MAHLNECIDVHQNRFLLPFLPRFCHSIELQHFELYRSCRDGCNAGTWCEATMSTAGVEFSAGFDQVRSPLAPLSAHQHRDTRNI